MADVDHLLIHDQVFDFCMMIFKPVFMMYGWWELKNYLLKVVLECVKSILCVSY